MARHAAGKSSQPVRESWSSRALKIAAKYLEDPQKWAAQDKFGKGLTVSQREVDPGFLVGDATEAVPPRRNRHCQFHIFPCLLFLIARIGTP
eukprot:COSAG05_NODE_10788_length_546_cov_1.959732_1_plen_91_part_10